MSGKHIAYMDSRYLYTDENDTHHYTEERPVYCGDWRDGTVLCDDCTTSAKERYPQGWHSYPGDICVHGKYVGGSGADLMCGSCEDGYTYWVEDDEFALMMKFGDSMPFEVTLTSRWNVSDDLQEKWESIVDQIQNIWYAGAADSDIRLVFYAQQTASGYWTNEE